MLGLPGQGPPDAHRWDHSRFPHMWVSGRL